MKGKHLANFIKVLLIVGFAIVIWRGNIPSVGAAETNGDSCYANFSNIECTTADGCTAQNVYAYCTFYANVWNPNKNRGLDTFTVTIKNASGEIAFTKTKSCDAGYCSIPVYLTEAGAYTVTRSATTSTGGSVTWDDKTLTVNTVSSCGAKIITTPSEVELSMTDKQTVEVEAKISGVFPDNKVLVVVPADTSIIKTSSNGMTDEDGDGKTETGTFTFTALKSGTTFAQFYIYETTGPMKLVCVQNIGITVGPEYTITYDANGGKGTFAAQTKLYGESITINNAVPTRTGYTFLGWSTDKTALSAEYKVGSTYSADENAVLYAVWERITYTITYDANGGIGAPSSQIKNHGETLQLSSVKPVRTGYTFIGWGDSSNPTAARYGAGSNYYANQSDVMTAIWMINTYTVTYDVGEGWAVVESESKDHGETLVLNEIPPTRIGYTFIGWATKKDSTTIVYKLGDSYRADKSITLYAVWKPEEYKIAYNLNGGSGTIEAQPKLHDISIKLTTTKPVREGYMFLGWSDYEDAQYVVYEAGAIFETNDNITLYAVWEPVKYTIIFHANKGENAPEPLEKKHDIPLNYLGEAYRTGYTFLGWSEDSSASTAQYKAIGNYTRNGSVTLYAVWEAKKYKVSYNANGGTGAPAAFARDYQTKVTLSKQVPTREGYHFLGWSEMKSAYEAEYASGAEFTVVEETTLYAVWKAKEYTVFYHVNGGKNAPSAQIKYHGVNLILSSEIPERAGYKFLGWNDNGVLYAAGETYYLNQTTNMYALWEKEQHNSDSTGSAGTTEKPDETQKPETPKEPENPGITVVVPKIQVITAASQKIEYKKGKSISLNAKTNGNGVLSYQTNNKKVAIVSKTGKITIKGYGKATITIRASETSSYKKAEKKVSITIIPKKMKLKSLSSSKKKYISASWSKDRTVTGYQMYICLRKDFKKGAYERTYKKSVTKMSLKGLKSKKTYYVKIRAYATVKGKKYYGPWSAVKKVKIK